MNQEKHYSPQRISPEALPPGAQYVCRSFSIIPSSDPMVTDTYAVPGFTTYVIFPNASGDLVTRKEVN